MTASDPPAWQQALAYSVTGQRHPELGRQDRPDLDQLVRFLRPRLPAAAGRTVVHPPPPDLVEGLGAAQLGAAVAELRARLGLDRRAGAAVVTASRTPDADDQRLLREVPPHHGG